MGSVSEDVDVVIIGAGLSGINSAYLLQQNMPHLSYVILEGRNIIGGTWAYWKYPGARSDSSSSVFRYSWHHWPHPVNFADADLIRDYIEDAAKAQGIDKHIRLNQKVGDISWSSPAQQWTLSVTDTTSGNTRPIHASWVIQCGGYYSYEKAQDARIPGLTKFQGEVIHPQFWKEDAKTAGKNIVLIGSGATAVTILPHIAKDANHVTMLQRSPSYVMSRPKIDVVRGFLQRWLPRRLADIIDWYREAISEYVGVKLLMAFPNLGRRLLRKQAVEQLPKGFPVDVHFNPKYTPFNQRLCFAPDGDFYKALNRPNCEIVTDHIETVTADGILLKSGREIKADMIITATGLFMQLFGGRKPIVDGVPREIHSSYAWRGCMLENVPNAAMILSYTTGTWTPGADARFRAVLSVMKEMRRQGATSATPTIDPAKRAKMPEKPALDLSSGYIQNALDRLPMSSGKYPWEIGTNYMYDAFCNLLGSPKTGMKYTVPEKSKTA